MEPGWRCRSDWPWVYHAGKALTFRDAGNINQVACLKLTDIDRFADFNTFGVVNPEFAKVLELPQSFELSQMGGLEPLGLPEGELNGIVAFVFLIFNLDYGAWTR